MFCIRFVKLKAIDYLYIRYFPNDENGLNTGEHHQYRRRGTRAFLKIRNESISPTGLKLNVIIYTRR